MEQKDYNNQIHANRKHNELVKKVDSLSEKLDKLIELSEELKKVTSKKKG